MTGESLSGGVTDDCNTGPLHFQPSRGVGSIDPPLRPFSWLAQEDDEVQVSTLIYAMGDQADDIFC